MRILTSTYPGASERAMTIPPGSALPNPTHDQSSHPIQDIG
jgi:hypothetical protein